MEREKEREGRKCREEQMGEDGIMHGYFFAYVRQRGVTWHATSALGAHMARLGPRMDPFKQFADPNMHLETLRT